MAERLAQLERWLERGGALWENMSRGFLSMEPNSLIIHMPESAGERSGMRGQAYGMGHFQCEAHEAVVIEFSPPPCVHWGMSLANGYWECVEYASRQSSLNRAQATLDPDGVMRAVIAHRDPGVANWLDPGGQVDGTLSIRFLHAERAPEISFQRLPLEALGEALPADTPRMDAHTRGEVLAARRKALLRRFRE